MGRLKQLLAGTPRDPGVYCVVRFPDSTEGRWFHQVPSPGTRLRSHGYSGRTWVVDEVLQSGRDMYTVFCVGRAEYMDKRRQASGARSDLPTELLELARRTSDAASEGRRRWKNRGYEP